MRRWPAAGSTPARADWRPITWKATATSSSRSARPSTACATRTAACRSERLRALAADRRVRMFEIKLSQGAKPGKGGILPGRQGDAGNRRHPRHSGRPGFDLAQPAPGHRLGRRLARHARPHPRPHRQAGRLQMRDRRLWLDRRPVRGGRTARAGKRAGFHHHRFRRRRHRRGADAADRQCRPADPRSAADGRRHPQAARHEGAGQADRVGQIRDAGRASPGRSAPAPTSSSARAGSCSRSAASRR